MISFQSILNSLPPEYPENLLEKNRNEFLIRKNSVIILDDDPTGTQTIYDVPVLTSWGENEIYDELTEGTPLFFILTNSRSLTALKANSLAVEIGKNIKLASEKTGRKTIVISRGDSTLRGHYPNEVYALGEGLGIGDSPHILIPALFQGGRYTINDIHYVREGDNLFPAAETPFASDTTFGYHSSDLKEYVEEKTQGRKKAAEVVSIGLDAIRVGGPGKVKEILSTLKNGMVCVVNAVSQQDLDVFTAGFYRWSEKFCPVLFRTAASFIPSLAGLPVRDPIQKKDLTMKGKGGVIIVGSYVPKSSVQLDFLKNNFFVEYTEIYINRLLEDKFCIEEIIRISDKINESLEKGEIIVVYTSRKLVTGKDPVESLQIVNRISAGIVEMTRRIGIRPCFFIAKGGITSSDIVTKSFGAKKARVLGQIIPGVPVWELTDCQKFPGLIYVPFPGNLGGDDAIYQAVRNFTD